MFLYMCHDIFWLMKWNWRKWTWWHIHFNELTHICICIHRVNTMNLECVTKDLESLLHEIPTRNIPGVAVSSVYISHLSGSIKGFVTICTTMKSPTVLAAPVLWNSWLSICLSVCAFAPARTCFVMHPVDWWCWYCLCRECLLACLSLCLWLMSLAHAHVLSCIL